MEKKQPYYRKSISTNFPCFSNTMRFVAFSRAIEIDVVTNVFPM